MGEIRYPHRMFEEATGLIEYEFQKEDGTPLLLALSEYDSIINPRATPDYQFKRIRRLFSSHPLLAESLIEQAKAYNESLLLDDFVRLSSADEFTGEPSLDDIAGFNNAYKFEELFALRLRSVHTLADALARVVGKEAAFDILVNRGNGDYDLLQYAMKLHPRLNEVGCPEIDTGELSLKDYSDQLSQEFRKIIVSAQPRYN